MNRELPQAPRHHGYGSEFGSGSQIGASCVLPVQTIFGTAAHGAVVCTHEGDLHGAGKTNPGELEMSLIVFLVWNKWNEVEK